MKRDFLKGLTFKVGENDITLPDEVIEKIISENGKDIEGTKTKFNSQIDNLKSELDSKDEMINNANSQIEKFKGMDIDGMQKAADEWKNKYTEFENQTKAEKEAFEKKLADQQYDFKVKEYLGQHQFTNDFVKEAFEKTFKEQGFKVGEDGKFLGADDYIKSFSEKNQGIFAPVEQPKKEEEQLPSWTVPGAGGQQTKDNGLNFNFTPIHDRPKN
jgi:hypothetical protein